MSGYSPKHDESLRTERKLQTRRPSKYRVILLNDDYTTMDFVVFVLETVFGKNPVEAVQVMLHVHVNGRGIAGVYVREIAEEKKNEVHRLAAEKGFPLRCALEKE